MRRQLDIVANSRKSASSYMRASKLKISVLLERSEYDRFAAYCDEMGFKKSTLIARLIRDHLDEQDFERQQSLFDRNGSMIEPRKP